MVLHAISAFSSRDLFARHTLGLFNFEGETIKQSSGA